mmetsp:Transcript_40318/g.83932  ORF Transcript_40318/g.83932 Transcript_40318/m.83932 type:complete len:86 (+) Transcript_40318:289-546(+)|eukprot:CAMPEP_0172457806 /NCGR_PEP_ID=MMETSP1065-20121228/24316_1 /TAXON_ID=265537 /ORGANISM="Amphiprora paludosa, Strain CCMP125" /LENGTH=85 /DNA_ID=CAMNT_0013211747 /DNA_START=201 /DNA_END=458 /DNA_ORIENTATION=-
MSDIEAEFKAAAEVARNDLPSSLSNDTKGNIYALFKQATEGDVQGSRPGMFDFTGRAKYDAWKKREGMSKEEAMKQYVELINSLK